MDSTSSGSTRRSGLRRAVRYAEGRVPALRRPIASLRRLKRYLKGQPPEPRLRRGEWVGDRDGALRATGPLQGRRVAALVHHGFEESELTYPASALYQAGATVAVVSPVKNDSVKGWRHSQWGDRFGVDIALAEADPGHFDGLLLPGGVLNPDALRATPEAVQFVRAFVELGKPVAAICHGPIMLIEAGVVRGRKLTSYRSIRTDLVNAGADWVDQEVVVDGGFITSRAPKDADAFSRELIAALGRVGATSVSPVVADPAPSSVA
jgi:protease I